MIRGLNHVTLAVTDLARSLVFYTDVLGMRLAAEWPQGAYLEVGPLWLCLSVDANRRIEPSPDYTHIAFDVAEADFDALTAKIAAAAPQWRDNKSEGRSLYFLDPDGYKLELHVGSLNSRMEAYRKNPPLGVWIAS